MRARQIKPAFFTNEDLAELPPLDRLLFIGLWCIADREGRMEYRPKRIRALLFPFEVLDIEPSVARLADKQLVTHYAVDGADFLQVVSFGKHQKPHMNEPASTLPACPGTSTNGGSASTNGESASSNVVATRAITYNLEPITLNLDKPKTTRGKRAKVGAERPTEVPEQVWNDFIALRAKKRAPLTQTALRGIAAEASAANIPLARAIAICCVKGWAGFEADWIKSRRISLGRYAAVLDGLTSVPEAPKTIDSDGNVLEG